MSDFSPIKKISSEELELRVSNHLKELSVEYPWLCCETLKKLSEISMCFRFLQPELITLSASRERVLKTLIQVVLVDHHLSLQSEKYRKEVENMDGVFPTSVFYAFIKLFKDISDSFFETDHQGYKEFQDLQFHVFYLRKQVLDHLNYANDSYLRVVFTLENIAESN